MGWLNELEQISDPRARTCRVLYSVPEILFVVVTGFLCGYRTLVDIDDWADAEVAWLRRHLPYASGTPSHDTLGRVLGRIHPSQLEGVLLHLMRKVLAGELLLPPVDPDCVLAVDGKELRGSKARSKGQEDPNKASHVVHAFLAGSKTLLGIEWVDQKSNEIKAVPKLFQQLDLRGMIVTLDAMGAQKTLVDQIHEAKAEVVVGLKGNQGNTHKDTRLLFEQPSSRVPIHTHSGSPEKDHGRIDIRTVSGIAITPALREDIPSLQAWPQIQSLVQVIRQSQRLTPGAVPTSEARYFLSSLPMKSPEDAQRHGKIIRAHWGVENHLHRTLDVMFHEDDCKVRERNLVQNLAVIRRLVLGIFQNDPAPGTVKKKTIHYRASFDRRDLALALWNKTLLPAPTTRKVIRGITRP